MSSRRASLVIVLCLTVAGCAGGGAPERAPGPSATAPTALAGSPTSPPEPASTPTGGRTPAASPTTEPVPGKPTGVTFRESTACLLGNDEETGSCIYPDESADPDFSKPTIEVTQTVAWRAPRTQGVEIRVYGVVACVSMPGSPKPGSSGPCLVEHTALPDWSRVLLATAPASAGKASWSWQQREPGCDIWYPVGVARDGRAYYAVVAAAYSTSGHSIFAIATAAQWVNPSWGPGDMPC